MEQISILRIIGEVEYLDFFFSSSSRHTSWNCDWSSDVCSSDLLYAKYTIGDTTKVDTVTAGVAYRGATTFATIPAGVYNLFARYQDSTANKISRAGVSFLGGKLYTVGARGDIT